MKSDHSFELHVSAENVSSNERPAPNPRRGEPGPEGTTRDLYEVSRPWPLINTEELRFIENIGGEYVGFVRRGDGRQQFEDIRVSRCAYYDEQERSIIEGFIATEGVNDEGTDELTGPNEINGFTLMVIRRNPSGHQVGHTEIISIQPTNFPGKHLSVEELHSVVAEVHDILRHDVSRVESSQVFRRALTRLETLGWQNNPALIANGVLASSS